MSGSKKPSFTFALVAVFICGVMIFSASAQTGQTGLGVITFLSGEDLEAILTSMDLKHEKLKDNAYRISLSGYNVIVFNTGGSLQLYAGFDVQSSMEQINEWNKTKRFSRAYIAKDGGSILESDLHVEGGLTRESIVKFFGLFEVSVSKFAEMLKTTSSLNLGRKPGPADFRKLSSGRETVGI